MNTSIPVSPDARQARSERWLLGDGTLDVELMYVKVTRKENSALARVSENPTRYSDEWEIRFMHDDGTGSELCTTFVFEHRHYDDSYQTRPASITNRAGKREFDSIRHVDNMTDTDALLNEIAQSVWREAVRHGEVKFQFGGSPFPRSAVVGSVFKEYIAEARLQLLDPARIPPIAISSILSDIHGKKTLSLAAAMLRVHGNYRQEYIDEFARKQCVLRMRFLALDEHAPPDGYTYGGAVRALVDAGLDLGSYEVPSGPDEVETTSLLYDACINQKTTAVAALVSAGADPFVKVQETNESVQITPFEYVTQNGLVDVLALMLESANEPYRLRMDEYLRKEYVQLDQEARTKLFEEFPDAKMTCAYADARMAQIAMKRAIEANAPRGKV